MGTAVAMAMITVQIDDSNFRRHLARFIDELGLEPIDVIRDQTRLLLRQIISFSPPKTLAQGRKAVAGDIRRSMAPIILDDFHLPRMHKRVAELAQRDDAGGLQAM